MIHLRKYRDADLVAVQRLVRDAFARFVAPDASPAGAAWWAAFHSLGKENRPNIRKRFAECPIRYVAVDRGRIVGTVMGTPDELKRIFVREACRGQGIGKALFAVFERDCRRLGATAYRITASLHAVPFYEKLGCKKTTGIRMLHGLKVQPMRKRLDRRHSRRVRAPHARETMVTSYAKPAWV